MGSVIGGGLAAFLYRQAREQAMNVLSEAREIAEGISRRTEEQIAVEGQGADARDDERLAESRQRQLTQASHQARLAMVARQGEVAMRVWSTALVRMRGRTPEQRKDSLAALLTDALAQLGSGSFLISCAEQDRDALGSLIRSEGQRHPGVDLRLLEEPIGILGGVIVSSEKGHRVVDNSWDARLRLVERTRRDEVMEKLS